MMPRWLPWALFGVLAVGGISLIGSGVAEDRPKATWIGAGFLLLAAICAALILVPKLREERMRLDVVLAHPDAKIAFGWLGEGLTEGGSVLVADTASVRILRTRDRIVRVEVPWREVDAISMWAQSLPGGVETRALLIRRVLGETLTFWVDRALAPGFLEDLETLRERAVAAG